MSQANAKAVAAVVLAAAIPVAVQWNHNSRLQNEIARLQAQPEAPVMEAPAFTTHHLPSAEAETLQPIIRLDSEQESDPFADDWLFSLAEAWEGALFMSDPVLRARRIAELLGSLTAETAPLVAEAFEQAQQSGIQFDEEHRLFLRAWGKLDGLQAVEHAVEHAGGVKNRSEILAALAGWASVSPHDARDWVEALEEGSAKEAIVYGLLDGWATVDFHSAAGYAESRPRARMRDSRFRRLLLQRALASGGIATAQQWVQGMSDAEENLLNKQGAFSEVIQTMLYRDPSAAAQWIAENAGEPFLAGKAVEPLLAGKAVADTAARLAEEAPLETLHWLNSLPGLDQGRWSAAASKVMDAWARQDALSAGDWLNENRLHPSYDNMAHQYARAVAADHPHIALAWARSISDTRLRGATELATALAHIERAGDAGRQALLDAGFSPETIDRATTVMMIEC
jgi:hypothetical protein